VKEIWAKEHESNKGLENKWRFSNCDAANMLVNVIQLRLVQLVCHTYAA
jgi:hypothetical protein